MKIEHIVLDCHNKVLREFDICKVSDLDMAMKPENGIDSLGIVSLVLEIEDQLNIELDDVLMDIRACKTIRELVDIVEKEYSSQVK